MSASSPVGLRPEFIMLASRPGSSKTISRPGSSKTISRPGSVTGSLPGSCRVSSRPGSVKISTRSGSSVTSSRPGSTKTISRPGSSHISSRPVSVKSDSRPLSTKSVRLAVGRNHGLNEEHGVEYCTPDLESECNELGSGSSLSDYETEEGRLSRALKNWMPDYVVRNIEPRERIVREPTYSARLGRQPRIQRSPSEESVATKLSLLSCSTNGKKKQKIRRRRKKKKTEGIVEQTRSESKWVALASRRRGALDRLMQNQAAHSLGLPVIENTIFDMLEKDEQKLVFNCGMNRGLHFAPGLKKSSSTTNVSNDTKPPQRRRASAGETKIHGPLINFQKIRQDIIQQKINKEARRQLILLRQSSRASLKKKSHKRRDSLRRVSTSSAISSTSDVVANVSLDPVVPVTPEKEPEVKTAMWAGDHKILEIDLNRDMTTKVKRKIETTARALSRVTGYGDNNGLRTTVGTLEEYPFLVDEDYGYIPKIVQRVRISPHLSRVIQHDIKLRMGRPRYHEISEQDLAMWNRGQELDRTHRNLKVFNWLHSLREEEFDCDICPDINDQPPGRDDSIGDMIHIRAVDEPKVMPLLERLKTEYVV